MDEFELDWFMRQVTGKEIRWSEWEDNDFFVPNGAREGNRFFGQMHEDSTVKERHFSIINGFQKSSLGEHWILVKNNYPNIDKPEDLADRVSKLEVELQQLKDDLL